MPAMPEPQMLLGLVLATLINFLLWYFYRLGFFLLFTFYGLLAKTDGPPDLLQILAIQKWTSYATMPLIYWYILSTDDR